MKADGNSAELTFSNWEICWYIHVTCLVNRCFHRWKHTGRTSRRTLSQAVAQDYVHSVADNILNASMWIYWSKLHKSNWTAEDCWAQLIWKIFVLNKVWKLDKKNSWFLSLLSKLDLSFIFGSKAEANCSISIKLLCQLLVSFLQAMLKKNSDFSNLDVSRVWRFGLVFQEV